MFKNIVFIPGLGFKSSIFNCVLPYFCEHEIKLMEYNNLKNENEIINDFFQKISDNSIIIGWSLGGLLSILFYYLYPNKVQKLILISSTPCFIEKNSWPGIKISEINNNMINFVKLVQYPNRSLEIRNYLKINYYDYSPNHLNFLIKSDLREIYSNIKKPVLNILGSKDKIINTGQYSYISKFHKTKLLDDEGHIPFITNPKQFSEIILEFIKND